MNNIPKKIHPFGKINEFETQPVKELDTQVIFDNFHDIIDKWSLRAAPHRGKWQPADHIKFIHHKRGVRDRDFIIIAQSNEYILRNDKNGSVAKSLQQYNEIRHRDELVRYEAEVQSNPQARKPKLQTNINWVQHAINCGSLDCADADEKINAQFENAFDTYVCMSSTWTSESRSQRTITSINCVWLDLDLKDQLGVFDSPEELAYYLLECFERTDEMFMPSAIIASGGGIHVYWKTTPIPIQAVSRFRVLMKELHKKIANFGLKADPACVDAPRVLRLCKTRNSKYRDSVCELLWKSQTAHLPILFDDFCDSVLPMTREEFKVNSEVRRNQEERANSRDLPNNYDENKPNIYKVIVADLEKLSRLKRFKRDGRKRFLWNYAVALSYNFKIGSATQLLIKKCNQLGLQYSKYQRQLQSAFKHLKDKSYQKYRLSVTKIIDQLEVTDAEMLSLNLRALISPEVRKIIRRKDKAIERKQKTKPRSKEQIAQDRRDLREKICQLIRQKVSKSEIARRLGVSRSTVYRLL